MPLIPALFLFAAVAYLYKTGRLTARNLAALGLAVSGAPALYDGFRLAVYEDYRDRYGVVTPGIVIRRLSSNGVDGSTSIGRRYGSTIKTLEQHKLHQILARRIVTGSAATWGIDYAYSNGGGQRSFGRDFISLERWDTLQRGQPVNVRYVPDRIGSSTIDGEGNWAQALAQMAIGIALLFMAALTAGYFTRTRRPRYVSVPAIVTAVEPVKYRDVERWHVRFMYRDGHGHKHEVGDEFIDRVWNEGDEGVAVYDSAHPEVASLQRLARAVASGA